MLNNAISLFPSVSVLFCAFLSAAIPWAISRINRSLHQAGDPSWKKDGRSISRSEDAPIGETSVDHSSK